MVGVVVVDLHAGIGLACGLAFAARECARAQQLAAAIEAAEFTQRASDVFPVGAEPVVDDGRRRRIERVVAARHQVGPNGNPVSVPKQADFVGCRVVHDLVVRLGREAKGRDLTLQSRAHLTPMRAILGNEQLSANARGR